MAEVDRDADPETAPGAVGTMSTVHQGVPDRGGWQHDAGRYKLGDEIARGGGGRVIAATDQRLGRAVACKLPLEEPGSLQRLVREAQLLSRLEHPSIVPVHDLARDADGTPFYVMKLLAGETLRARIAGRSFEDRIALLPTLIAIAEAVAYAHHNGIVHRDLKPGNVIVGEFGETFVIDWGLARHVTGDRPASPEAAAAAERDGLTMDGAIVGTPAYMAPEQARGEPSDVRTDVYGLGALAYHVLGGDAPYTGDSSTQVIARVLEAPPLALARREPRVPAELAAIVGKAMARDAADRYPTAAELAADLRRYQAGRLVAAHRYSPWQRARRWIRRHRVAIAGGAAVIAAGIAIAVTWPSPESPAALCARAGTDAARALDTPWPPARRAASIARIRTLAGPGAVTAAGAIGTRVEAYVHELVEAHVDACAATHVRGTQSGELLDRRILCLARRADDLDATLALLETTTATEIDGAVRATGQLPAITSCADPERLRERVPMPTEPTARAQAEALHTSLAATRALLTFGRYPEALASARKVMTSVGPATYAPYASQAHYVLGRALQALTKHDESIQELQLAQRSAEIGHDDELRADVLDRLAEWAVDEATLDPKRIPEATELLAQLAALATRLDAPARLAAGLEREAVLAENRGDQQEAIALSSRALALNEQANDRDGIATSASNVGMGLIGAGRYPEALPYLDRSTQLYRQLYGDDHPTAARMAGAYGAIYMNTNRGAEAVAAYRRAREIYRRAGLADTREDLAARSNLAASLGLIGRPDEAEAELVAVLKLVGDDPLGIGHILVNLGASRAVAKQHEAAAAWLRKALAHTEQHVGANHPLTTTARAALAVELIELGQPREALPLLEATLPAQLKESGQGSDDVAITQLALARAYLETGQARRAIELGDQALAFYATSTTAGDRGNARFVVARALVAAGADRARAIELATAARADFTEAKAPDLVAAVDRLLAQARR